MKFAAKRLRNSDLTLFDVQHKKLNVGGQKAINLNRSVFVDLLYPSAPMLAAGAAVKFPCELRVFGPQGISEPRIIQRKVIAAGGTQKNWRLNGETIAADSGATRPDRYDDLKEDDIAVFCFDGEGTPTGISLVLLSASHSEDIKVHEAIDKVLSNRGMCALDQSELQTAIDASDNGHPIRELLDAELDEALEDAVQGSAAALTKLKNRSIRRTTHEAFAETLSKVERIGRDGEALIDAYLKSEVSKGNIVGHVWESEINATHPHDFSVEISSGVNIEVEVKTTTGLHERQLMFSHAEIEFASHHPSIEVWRLSQLSEGVAELRKSNSLNQIAKQLVEASNNIGEGVCPNGWTIQPKALGPWSEPVSVSRDDDPNE